MAKVYVIQQASFESYEPVSIQDFNQKTLHWVNLYCVGSKIKARKSVSRAQRHSDTVNAGFPVHFLYRFEELVKF